MTERSVDKKTEVRSTEEALSTERALKLALEALEVLWDDGYGGCPESKHMGAITAIREALMSVPDGAQSRSDEEQPAQEPVAVKHMMRWVDKLKRLSDNGQHMNIPSELSAGTCLELAIELEQFIKSPPANANAGKPWVQATTWRGLTDEDIEELAKWADKNGAPWHLEFARAIEAKLKAKNSL